MKRCIATVRMPRRTKSWKRGESTDFAPLPPMLVSGAMMSLLLVFLIRITSINTLGYLNGVSIFRLM